MNAVRFAALGFLVFTFSVSAGETNKFESVVAGFSLEKPAGWRFASLEQVTRNRASVRLSDEELQKQVEQQPTAPLVVLMKHEEPYEGLNPSFQVILRSLPPSLAEASPRQILELVLPTIQKGYPDYTLESPIREFDLSGHTAAESVATYTVRTKDGGVFPTRGRMIVVPRGKFMFLISASAPPSGSDQSKAEFLRILASIRISE